MNCDVAIIGGGTAGMEAAGLLAGSGYKVMLFEKDKEPGGHLNDWYHLFPDRRNGEEVRKYLNKKVKNDNLKFLGGHRIDTIEKNKKNFTINTMQGNEIIAEAIIIATGFDLFKSERKEEYGYGIYDNVITSADLEAKFRIGNLKLSNGEFPERIGIVHCVGSRDAKSGNLYCSKLCCVTAVKQAIELKEYLPESRIFCFYMDMRMGGALYEELYMESQEKYGINFIRGKVSEVGETINHKLVVKVEDTLAGRPLKMELDMLVLMAGMEMAEASKKLSASLGLKTGENRFFQASDNHFGSNLSNVNGVFYAGSCTAPMNITETISHARAAVFEVIDYLKDDRK
jgi:heterodisulfide reductase subunit A